MTDQDNLRDRIAWTIFIAERGLEEVSAESWDWLRGDYRHTAQAIIDELGLTVEERIDEPGKRGINPVQRIVGEWEEQR